MGKEILKKMKSVKQEPQAQSNIWFSYLIRAYFMIKMNMVWFRSFLSISAQDSWYIFEILNRRIAAERIVIPFAFTKLTITVRAGDDAVSLALLRRSAYLSAVAESMDAPESSKQSSSLPLSSFTLAFRDFNLGFYLLNGLLFFIVNVEDYLIFQSIDLVKSLSLETFNFLSNSILVIQAIFWLDKWGLCEVRE